MKHNETKILSNIIFSIAVPATKNKFVAKNKFVVDTNEWTKIKIFKMNDNFVAWFGEKVEDPFPGSFISVRNIVAKTFDGRISRELFNSDDLIETTLAEIYFFMKYRISGEAGTFFDTIWSNIFFVRDVNDKLRTINFFWNSDGEYSEGWSIHATEFGSLSAGQWSVGNRVFYHNTFNYSG